MSRSAGDGILTRKSTAAGIPLVLFDSQDQIFEQQVAMIFDKTYCVPSALANGIGRGFIVNIFRLISAFAQ